MLGKVLITAQRVHSIVAEVFADSGSSKRSEVLHRVRVGRGGHDDNAELQRAILSQSFYDSSHVSHLLTDGDIDAEDGRSTGFMRAALVDDRVHADRSLSSLSVTNDQLTLTAGDNDYFLMQTVPAGTITVYAYQSSLTPSTAALGIEVFDAAQTLLCGPASGATFYNVLRTHGSGPTTNISPHTPLNNSGSSSILTRRNQ